MGGCVVVILIKKEKRERVQHGEVQGVPPSAGIIIRPSHPRMVKELQTIYECFVNTSCIFPILLEKTHHAPHATTPPLHHSPFSI